MKELTKKKQALLELYNKVEGMDQKRIQVKTEANTKELELDSLQENLSEIQKEISKLGSDNISYAEASTEDEISLSPYTTPTKKTPILEEESLEELESRRKEIFESFIMIDQEKRKASQHLELIQNQYTNLRIELERDPQEREQLLLVKKAGFSREIELLQKDNRAAQQEIQVREESMKNLKQQFLEIETAKKNSLEKINALLSEQASQRAVKSKISATIALKSGELSSQKQTKDQISYLLEEKKKQAFRRNRETDFIALRGLVEEAKKRGLSGCYGLFIDLVSLPDNILGGFEALTLSKLFGVVVEDEETARAVINLNKELRGGKVDVYPLSWVSQGENPIYPDPNRVIILHEHVEVESTLKDRPEMQLLVQDLIGGNCIVSSIEDAYALSKEFDVNCVTLEGEIVYKKGYLTKLGYKDKRYSTLKDYLSYRKLRQSLLEEQEKIVFMEQELNALKEQELSFKNSLQTLINTKDRLVRETDQHWNNLSSIQRAWATEQKLISELKQRLEFCRHLFQTLDVELASVDESLKSPTKGGVSKEHIEKVTGALNKAQEEVKKKNLLFNELEKSLFEVESRLTRVRNQELEKKKFEMISTIRKRERELCSESIEVNDRRLENLDQIFENKKLNYERMKKEVSKLKELSNKMEIDYSGTKTLLGKAQLQVQELSQKRFDIQNNTDSLEGKVRGLNVDLDQEEDQIWKLDKLTDSKLIKELKNFMVAKFKYTQQDRSNFELLEAHFKTHSQYQAEVEDLSQSRHAFSKIVEHTDPAVERKNKILFSRWKKNFEELFKKMIPEGQAELKLVSGSSSKPSPIMGKSLPSSNNKEVQLQCLFDGSSKSLAPKAFQLSAGQATMVSVCLLFSLLQFCPSGLCCLDEIDAELDETFLKHLYLHIQGLDKQVLLISHRANPKLLDELDSSKQSLFVIGSEEGSGLILPQTN